MSYHPYLYESKPPKEPCSLLGGKMFSNKVRSQGTQGEVPVDPTHTGMLSKQGVLFVESMVTHDTPGLPVIDDHRCVAYTGQDLLLIRPAETLT